MDGYMNEWIQGWMDGWMGGYMNGWMGVWVDGWIGGWVSRRVQCVARHWLYEPSTTYTHSFSH